ncbi:HinT-interacting membrane complex protein P80 [Mycoplasma sp. 480]|uniref:HinT-interacting membrane complex protein P80 n=1 Tax=Mycoplasma sp. 480 TaxID=3440155 RepID=UPI003F50F43E
MSKEKLSKKLARLNSKSEKKQKKERTPEQIKKRKILNGVLFASAALVVSGLAIGIPLGITNAQPTKIAARADSDILVSISTPNGPKNLNLQDIINATQTDSVINKEQFDEAQKVLINYLYEEEYEASQLFKKAWDKSYVAGKTSANDRFNPNFKSYDDLKQSQQKFLEDERRRYQRTYGFQNWESEFNKYISTDPKFGGAVNFDKAVEYLTYKEAEKKAFARFTPEFSTTYLYKDVKNRVLSEDIKDKNGNIVYKKGDRLFKDIIILEDDADKGSNVVNGFIPNIERESDKSKTESEKEKIKDEYKVSAFLTNSYVKEYMNANNVINKFYFNNNALLKDKFSFFDVSQLVIHANQNSSNAQDEWTIAKADLKELLRYSVTQINSNDLTTQEVKTTLSLIENFKGNTATSDENQKSTDRILLNTINSSVNKTNAQNLGQLPLRNLSQIFDSEDSSYGITFLDNVFSAKEATHILSTTLFSKIKEKLFANGHENLLPDASTLTNKKLTEINELNKKIADFIDKLSDGELKKAGEAFKETFGETTDSSYRIHTIYKLTENSSIIYSSKGLNIILKNSINTFDKLQEILKKELQLNANNQINSSITNRLKINDLFNELKNESFVLKDTISDEKFKTKLLTDVKSNKSEEEKTNYIKSLEKNIDNKIISYSNDLILKINTKIETYLTEIKKYNLNADFNFDNTKNYWTIRGKTEKSDVDTIYDALQKHFGIIKNK